MNEKITLLEKAGRNLIDREHQYAQEEFLDNQEYIPSFKRVIDALSSTLIDEGAPKTDVDAFSHHLYEYAKNLFVNLWKTQAEDSGEFTPKELTKAKRVFDEFYSD
jgi:hypothetical protein